MQNVSERNYYIYLFFDIPHFKRIHKFLVSRNYKNLNLNILFFKNFEDIELIKSNIDFINNSCIKIKFFNFHEINLLKKINPKNVYNNLHIIIDKNHSENTFKLCGKFLNKKNSKIIFFEHNLYFCWGYTFSHKIGYRRTSLFDLLLSRNIYRLIFISVFSKLRDRIFERKINILDIMKHGIVPFADQIYLYDRQSYKYFQENKAISKINKSIIDYPYDFHPKLPNNNEFYNICIFTYGSFKVNNKKIIERNIKVLKKLIQFIKKEYATKNHNITLKLKNDEIYNFKNLNLNFDTPLNIVNNIDDKRDFFHHVIVPIDSFVLIEYLRSDVKIYTYNMSKKQGPTSKYAKGIFNIDINF